MRVVELWRYPVKSMGGEQLRRAEVTEVGLRGDRRWGLVDRATGNVLTARREPRLLFASARLEGDAVVITLPDGTETADDEVLSRWLEHPVALTAAGDEGGTYEAPLDFERDEQWVSWQGPGRAWHDSPKSRVSLVSTSTLGDWDRRRFRANILVDGADEDQLVGRELQLGSARLSVSKRIDRCVMVTRPQPGLDRDLDVLRTINRDRGSCLAIGATITRTGQLEVGDTLTAD